MATAPVKKNEKVMGRGKQTPPDNLSIAKAADPPIVPLTDEDGTPVTKDAKDFADVSPKDNEPPVVAVAAPAPYPPAPPPPPVAAQAAFDPFEGLPQELKDALNDADVIEGAQQFVNNRQAISVQLRRIEVVQANSSNHPKVINGRPTVGQLAVTDREGEAEYRQSMRIMLIDPLMFTKTTIPEGLKNLPEVQSAFTRDRDMIGARMMWAFDAAGTRSVTPGQAPICSSANGLTPWNRHIGTMVTDPRYALGEGVPPIQHKIGSVLDPTTGDYVAIKNPCLTCPFAAWLSDSEVNDPKLKKPMCQATPTYIVYSVDDDEMFILKGTNATLAAALQGVRANAFGGKHDHTALPGLMYYFSINGYFNPETGEHVPLKGMQDRLLKLATLEERQTYIKRFVPTYPNRPDGQPSKNRPLVPVYPAMLSVTMAMSNGYNQPMIPQFTLLDGSVEKVDGPFHTDKNADWLDAGVSSLTPEELGKFLSTVREYTMEGYRDSLMAIQASPMDGFLQPALNAPSYPMTLPVQAGQASFAPVPGDLDVNAPFNN